MAENSGSRRVLEKVGLTHTSSWMRHREGAIDGSEQVEVGYELMRAEWQG